MTKKFKKFIDGLPKAELHCHIEGTLEPSLEFKLAQKNHINLGVKSPKDINNSYNYGLSAFLYSYYAGMKTLITKQDFYDLTWSYLKKMSKSHVKHVELFFDPQAHTIRGISFATVIDGIHQAAIDARALGVDTQLIMCLLRDFSKESARKTLIQAKPYHDRGWILGLGLDSDEHHNPPLKFMMLFARAKAQGYKITMHCDPDQVDSIHHIKQALEIIEVERIDHGVNILENSDLLEFAVQKHLGFTACPISNLYIYHDMKADQIKKLLDAGALVSINSDDPAYMGSNYINDNYYQYAEKTNSNKNQIVKIAKNSFLTSWISKHAKQVYIRQINDYIKNFR